MAVSAQTWLSKRELQVLRLAAEGETNARIGWLLSISPNTVKNHVVTCMNKLGAVDRTHAVVIAIRQGLIA